METQVSTRAQASQGQGQGHEHQHQHVHSQPYSDSYGAQPQYLGEQHQHQQQLQHSHPHSYSHPQSHPQEEFTYDAHDARSISGSEGLPIGVEPDSGSSSPNSYDDGSERDNEEKGEAQMQPQQPCSTQYLSAAVNPGAGIGEDGDDATRKSLPLSQSSVAAATSTGPPSLSSPVVGSPTTTASIPTTPDVDNAGSNNNRRARPNLHLDLLNSQNLTPGRHPNPYALTQAGAQPNIISGAGMNSFSPDSTPPPPPSLIGCDLQSPAWPDSAISTTSSNSVMSSSTGASVSVPASASVSPVIVNGDVARTGHHALAAATTSMAVRGWMPGVGVMPSPFEYPVTSPYLGASAADGYFDLPEMDRDESVAGALSRQGQGHSDTLVFFHW
jgi:hypothetical protein